MDEEIMNKSVNLEDLINYLIFCKSEIKEISLQDLSDTWDSINGFVDLTKEKSYSEWILSYLHKINKDNQIIKNSLEQIIQDRL